MKSSNNLFLVTSPSTLPARKPRLPARALCRRTHRCLTGKERDAETGLYYYGARYLDSKTGRWLSGDPALGEYIPSAPVSEEARKRNGSLPGMGGVFNYANLHVYHYAGNNPVRYTDPDGRLQVDSNGNILFWPEGYNQDGSVKVERIVGNSGASIDVIYGYIKTNDGTRIEARYNLSENIRAENFDCHGYTFTDGLVWINNTQIGKLLSGDGYKGVTNPSVGDILIQRNSDNEIMHSAIVTGVDLEKGEVTVMEAVGTVEFKRSDGRYTRLQERTYKMDGTDGTIEFYQRPANKVIE